MMRIKLLQSRAGNNPDGSELLQNAGDVIEVSEELGARMIEADQAVKISGSSSPSSADTGKDNSNPKAAPVKKRGK